MHEIPASARRSESSGRKEKEQTCVYTRTPCTPRTFYETGFEYANQYRKPTLFLPADSCDAARATAASTIASDQVIPDNEKSTAVNSALAVAGLHCVDP
jgi:hypothetical protein